MMRSNDCRSEQGTDPHFEATQRCLGLGEPAERVGDDLAVQLTDRSRPPIPTSPPTWRLISATTTSTGLTVHAAHDPEWYAKGIRITNTELAAVPLHPHDFHGEWNYTIFNAQTDLA